MRNLYDVVAGQKIFTEDEHSDLVTKLKNAYPDKVLYNTDDKVEVSWEAVVDSYLEDGEEMDIVEYTDILTDRNSNCILKPINDMDPIDSIIKAIDELDFTPSNELAIEIFVDAADDDEFFRTKDEAKIYLNAMKDSEDFEFMDTDEFNNILCEYTLIVVPGKWMNGEFEKDEDASPIATIDFQDYISLDETEKLEETPESVDYDIKDELISAIEAGFLDWETVGFAILKYITPDMVKDIVKQNDWALADEEDINGGE